MSYEYLEHTADIKIKVKGNTLEDAFIESSYALTDIITDHTKVKSIIKKEITAKGEDLKSLLYDFLEQFLILIDSENFILSKVIKLEINNYNLKAIILGDNNIKDYKTDTQIKAITYHEMEIDEKNNIIQFVPDI